MGIKSTTSPEDFDPTTMGIRAALQLCLSFYKPFFAGCSGKANIRAMGLVKPQQKKQ